MPAKSKVAEAPYAADGSLLHYAETRYGPQPEWRPNDPFTATLWLAETRRGRSAAYFIWRSGDGREYPMFISDMLLLVQSGVTIKPGGSVSTRWMVTKRGANYGIRHAPAEEVGDA